jgi:hypothetical protein
MKEEPFRQVKALHGVSLMHRVTEPFGFETFDLPDGPMKSVMQAYMRLFMSALQLEGKERVPKRETLLAPKRIVMSRQQFLLHYLHEPRESREPSRSAPV